MRRCGASLAVAALLLLGARAARADVEEFATFGIARQEEDDESTLDHFLTRFPRTWRDEWARGRAGLRTSQGCLTSGQWFIDTDFRARAALGERAWLGVDYFQSESDIFRADHLDLSFHFPLTANTGAFAMFRPSAEKAAQDFAIGWEMGADTSAFQLRATWTLEDVFNNFWAFRQTQVGGLSEPYEVRPYEPALFLAVRGSRARVEAGAKWLTPSAKRIADLSGNPIERRELWGAAGHAIGELTIGAFGFEVRTDHRQARSHTVPVATSALEVTSFRRQWSAEAAARTTFAGQTTVEARYLYQSRLERDGPAAAEAFLAVDDRFLNLDVEHVFTPRIAARAGGIYDRIGKSIANRSGFNYPTRNESRAYVGLALTFGRVQIAGIEGIELDPEHYDVWLVHDKGFLQLQTTF